MNKIEYQVVISSMEKNKAGKGDRGVCVCVCACVCFYFEKGDQRRTL